MDYLHKSAGHKLVWLDNTHQVVSPNEIILLIINKKTIYSDPFVDIYITQKTSSTPKLKQHHSTHCTNKVLFKIIK